MLVALVLSLVDLPLTRALMTDPAIPSPEEPMKPRALTYTEMMNGGRQQMDGDEHALEQELEYALAGEGTNSIPLDRAVS